MQVQGVGGWEGLGSHLATNHGFEGCVLVSEVRRGSWVVGDQILVIVIPRKSLSDLKRSKLCDRNQVTFLMCSLREDIDLRISRRTINLEEKRGQAERKMRSWVIASLTRPAEILREILARQLLPKTEISIRQDMSICQSFHSCRRQGDRLHTSHHSFNKTKF